MKINEVEKLLEISKATIRFYEREGLLSPQRKENSYREYSDEDIQILKKIIVLRKIGMSVEDIEQVLNGKLSLQDALEKNVTELHEQMAEIEGAIKVCTLMQRKEENLDSFDENYYLNIIRTEEENGQNFIDIAMDYVQFEIEFLDRITGGGKKTITGIAVILFIAAIARGGVSHFTGDGFWNGFWGLFEVILIASVVLLPAFLLRKKEKAADIYLKTIHIISVVFLALILLLLGVMFLNSKLHFLF